MTIGYYAGDRSCDRFTANGRWTISLASPRPKGTSVWALLAAVAMIAVVLGGCGSAGTGAHTVIPKATAVPTSLRLNPQGDGLFCATQIAWSPDSARLAVLGNAENCSGSASGRTPGLILVYAVPSGKLIQTLHPDTAVLALPVIARKVAGNSAAGGLISTLTYNTLTWTPDNQAILLNFDLELLPSASLNNCCTSIYGLLRLDTTDPSRTKVWLDSNPLYLAPLERWNLVSGAVDTPPAPARATAYRWNAAGILTPARPAGQAIGTPDGGNTFTVWQSGMLLFATKSDKATESTTVLAQDVAWLSYVSPISPDGLYFYPDLTYSGSLVPPSTQHAAADEPVFAPHDQALVELAQQMMRTPSPSQNINALVAWRPDGSYLAALAPDGESPNPAALTISIYDTASGKLVKQVKPNFTGLTGNQGGNTELLWSPDGSHLLLLDNLYGVITIWGPGELPA
jgi:WD40 repeat protein